MRTILCPLTIFLLLGSWSNVATAWSLVGKGADTTSLAKSKDANRRWIVAQITSSVLATFSGIQPNNQPCFADDGGDDVVAVAADVEVPPPLASLSGDAKKLFNDGRVFESQGNIAAAQRLYSKVTKMEPRFVYGWSNLGNTQVALGELAPAEISYTTAVDLCRENLARTEQAFGLPRCKDLDIILLNRGTLRLNTGRKEEALADLESSSVLRGRPDAVILQNLALSREKNGYFSQSDRDYTMAISMSANEVKPFWLRSALVKLQLGDINGGFDLLKRVENRFPEAPEVKAAYATFLAVKGDQIEAQRKYLEMPNQVRKKFTDKEYLTQVISWPPAAIDTLGKISKAVGDK